jgi:hypothetical protein
MLGTLRRLNWWQTLILILCLFGCFLACLALWLRSTGDLAAIDARATRLGLPTSTAAITFATTTPERTADWQRLLILGEQLKPYADTDAAKGWALLPGTPLPPEVAKHHAGLDQGLLNEAATILNRLGDAPVDANRELSPAAKLPDAAALRRLMRLWCERIALSTPADLLHEISTAAALIPPREPLGLMRLMVAANLIDQWTTAVAARAADLGTDSETVATLADHLAPLPPTWLAPAWRNDLASLRTFIGDADPSRIWNVLGREGGMFSLDAWGFAVALRAGRARTVELMQDIAAATQAAPLDAAAHIAAARAAESAASTPSWWRPGTLLPAMTLPVTTPVMVNAHTARLKLQVLAAELRKGVWPADILDPNHAPVRRVERDGKLIGAYSVGGDGADNAGDLKADRCWALYEPLGSPKAGDPLPNPAVQPAP